MTPELREGLYQLDPYELGYEDGNNKDTSPPAAQGLEPDENLLNQLLSMSLNEAGLIKSLLATKNLSFDAALEYYFQHEHDNGFLVNLGFHALICLLYYAPHTNTIAYSLRGERKQEEEENQEYSIGITEIIYENANF